MKKKLIFTFVMICLLFFVWNCFKTHSIKINYYTSIPNDGFGDFPWWEVIRSKEELLGHSKYLNINLKEFNNVDFTQYAVILSNGRKINKIVYRKSLFIFIYNYSGIAYLQDKLNENTIFVYLIDANKKLFVDRHFGEETQYIIEK